MNKKLNCKFEAFEIDAVLQSERFLKYFFLSLFKKTSNFSIVPNTKCLRAVHLMHTAAALNHKYIPFYKHSFRTNSCSLGAPSHPLMTKAELL